jgi:hypothetical protein
VTKITVVRAVVTITMTKLASNGLNVSATVEDGFMKLAWKMEQITSSHVMPAFYIAYLLFIRSIL